MTTEREMAEKLRGLADTPIDDNLAYIQAADEAMRAAASLLETVAAERDALDKLIAELKRWDTFAFGGNVSQQGGVGIMKTEMLERLTAIRSRSGSKP